MQACRRDNRSAFDRRRQTRLAARGRYGHPSTAVCCSNSCWQFPGEVDGCDGVVARVAFDHQPLAAPDHMLPEFAVKARRVFSDVDISVPGLWIGVVVGRTRDGSIAAIAELVMVAQTAAGAFDA